MEIHLRLFVLLTLTLFINGSTVFGSKAHLLQQLKSSAQYHLHSFKRNLDDIRALQDEMTNSDDIEFRSVDGNLRWDLYLPQMLTFCEDLKYLKTERTSTAAPITTLSLHRDKDSFVLSTTPYEGGDGKSKWYLPTVRPIRAQAERDGTKVRLVFEVIHNRPAYAARVNSFQYAKASFEIPAGVSGNFVSRVQFVTDATACKTGEFDFEQSYVFGSNDLEGGGASLQIDTCGFDKYQNMSLEFDERIWLTKNETVKETPNYPRFRITSGTKPDIMVRRDRNTQLYVDLILNSTTIFIISGHFFEYNLRIPFDESIGVRLNWTGHPQIQRSGKRAVKILSVKLLKSVISGNKGDDGDAGLSVNATVRIKVMRKGFSLGGNLVLRALRYRNDFYNRALVNTVSLSKFIKFHQPGERYPPLGLEPRVYARNNSKCTEEGNSIFPREGPNCTLSCNAVGSNISSITITKTDSKLVPYRSISYVLNYTAFAMIDVGLASPANEGSYLCVAQNDNGRVEKSSTLYTTGFPKVADKESTLKQMNNGTSEVTCRATGKGPLKIKINIKIENGQYTRIDKNPNYHRSIQKLDEEMIMKLLVRTEDLKFPKYILSCEVNSERGFDRKLFYLYNAVKDYYEPVAPKLDEGSTRITSFENGTTAITCKAFGAFPLEVMVLYGGRSENFRIDDDNSNVKTETSNAESKTATLLVNTKSIRGRTSWLHCFVKNQYGDDILDYDLDKYI